MTPWPFGLMTVSASAVVITNLLSPAGPQVSLAEEVDVLSVQRGWGHRVRKIAVWRSNGIRELRCFYPASGWDVEAALAHDGWRTVVRDVTTRP